MVLLKLDMVFLGSIIDYSSSIELDSTNSETYRRRGIARWRSGDISSAISDFDDEIQLFPNEGATHFNHGMTMEMLDDIEQAGSGCVQTDRLGYSQSIVFIREYCRAWKTRY